MIRIKTQKVLDDWGNIVNITAFPRAIFRTQPKVYGGALLRK